MVRLLTLIPVVLLLLPSPVLSQGWEPATSAPEGNSRQRHDDVGFGDATRGWLVNTRGEIWKTDDAGHVWELQLDTNGFFRFRSLAPIDRRHAFAGTVQTPGAVLFATDDGGESWTDVTNRISGTQPIGICGMSVVTDRLIFGVGAYYGSATLIKSTNGGVTWTGKSMRPLAQTLVDVHFINEDVGFATGGTSEQLTGEAVVLRTEDGGTTWTSVYESTRESGIVGEWGWKISFPTPMVGYISVEYATNYDSRPAKVLKTVDGGLTWSPLDVTGSVSRAGLQGIGFISADRGWASGRGVTSFTEDGGASWTQLLDWSPEPVEDVNGTLVSSPEGQLDGSINRILVVSDTLAIAVGKRVYRLNPALATGTTPATSVPERFRILEAYPNPFEDQVTLEYDLMEPGEVRVEVMDALGRSHGIIRSGREGAGRHRITWDGRSTDGQRLPSGMYFLLMDLDRSPELKQVVLIR